MTPLLLVPPMRDNNEPGSSVVQTEQFALLILPSQCDDWMKLESQQRTRTTQIHAFVVSSLFLSLFYLRVYNQHHYLMGQTLSEPITTKESSEGGDARVKYGASCMQGWRISKSFEAFLSTR